LEAEKTLALLSRDAAAAEAALPEANAAFTELHRQLARIDRERDEAAWRAAVETVRDQAQEAKAALEGFLRWEAKFRSVAEALEALASRRIESNKDDPAAPGGAVEIHEIIRRVKAEAGVEHDHAAGPRLIEQLLAGAAARL
jgi:hypothetical protein